MTVSFDAAVNAYNSAAKAAMEGVAQSAKANTRTEAGESFTAMVGDVLKNAVEAGHKGEEMTLKGIAGSADMRDVVLAVNNAELALQTVVSMRDKVTSAYKEIMRMPI